MLNKTGFKKTSLAMAMTLVSTGVMAAQLEEVVVTAQKRQQSLQDVPISLDVIQADDLSDRGISSIDGLAQATPSLVFQKGNGPSANNFVIRGIGSISLEGGVQPAVSMTIDGVPLGRISEFSAEMGDIERIEVLRGPQGTLYGRNATGGVINVVRANASHDFEAYIEQTFTDDEEYTTRAMINGSLSENVAGRVSGFYTDREAYVENLAGGPDIGAEESYGVLGKLVIDVSDTVSVSLAADYRKVDTSEGLQSIARIEGQPGDTISGAARDPNTRGAATYAETAADRLLAIGNGDAALGLRVINDPFTTTTDFALKNDTENYGVSAIIDWEISDSVSLKSITAHRSNEILGLPDVDYTPFTGASAPARGVTPGVSIIALQSTNLGPNVGSGYTTVNEFEYTSQEFRFEGSTDNLEWLAGVYFNSSEETAESEVPLLIANSQLIRTDPRDVGVEVESYAAFGDVTFSISDTFRVFAGLRWTVEQLDSRINNQRHNIPVALLPAFGPAGLTIGTTAGNDIILGDSSTFINPAIFGALSNANAPLFGLPVGIPFAAITQAYDIQTTASDTSEDWSGRIGGSLDVSDDLQVYASASRGFIGAGANIGRLVNPANLLLDPSTSTAFEVGFKSDLFDGSVRFNGSFFSQEVEDSQTTRLVPGTTDTESFNAGNLDIQGVEMSVTWAATDFLTIDAGLSYLDTELSDLIQPCFVGQTIAQGCNLTAAGGSATLEQTSVDYLTAVDNNPAANVVNPATATQQDVSGNQMIQAPKLAYNLNVRLDIPSSDLPFDMYTAVAYTWQDDVQHQLTYDPLSVQESYGLVDVTFAIEDKDGDWKVTVFGKNVGDETYSSNLSVGGGLGSQGRLMTRVGRGAQAYWGIKGRYNF